MNSNVKAYLLSVVAAAFLCSVVSATFAKGSAKKMTEFICGLLLILVIAGPFAKADYSVFPQTIAKTVFQSQQARNRVKIENRELTSAIIKQNTEAYILDKATQKNMTLTVEVTMEGTETYPYPGAVTLSGRFTYSQRMELEKLIERDLAIPVSRQEWIVR